MAATVEDQRQPLSWKISGMDCAGCVAKVRGAVEKMPGVSDVNLSLISETLKLTLDESRTSRQAVEQRVKSLGFGAAAMAPVEPVASVAASCGCCHDKQGIEEAPRAAAPAQALAWKIGGMDCAGCVAKVRGAVEKMPGVTGFNLSLLSETLKLTLDETQTKPDDIEKRVGSLGYSIARVIDAPSPQTGQNTTQSGSNDGHGPKRSRAWDGGPCPRNDAPRQVLVPDQ